MGCCSSSTTDDGASKSSDLGSNLSTGRRHRDSPNRNTHASEEQHFHAVVTASTSLNTLVSHPTHEEVGGATTSPPADEALPAVAPVAPGHRRPVLTHINDLHEYTEARRESVGPMVPVVDSTGRPVRRGPLLSTSGSLAQSRESATAAWVARNAVRSQEAAAAADRASDHSSRTSGALGSSTSSRNAARFASSPQPLQQPVVMTQPSDQRGMESDTAPGRRSWHMHRRHRTVLSSANYDEFYSSSEADDDAEFAVEVVDGDVAAVVEDRQSPSAVMLRDLTGSSQGAGSEGRKSSRESAVLHASSRTGFSSNNADEGGDTTRASSLNPLSTASIVLDPGSDVLTPRSDRKSSGGRMVRNARAAAARSASSSSCASPGSGSQNSSGGDSVKSGRRSASSRLSTAAADGVIPPLSPQSASPRSAARLALDASSATSAAAAGAGSPRSFPNVLEDKPSTPLARNGYP